MVFVKSLELGKSITYKKSAVKKHWITYKKSAVPFLKIAIFHSSYRWYFTVVKTTTFLKKIRYRAQGFKELWKFNVQKRGSKTICFSNIFFFCKTYISEMRKIYLTILVWHQQEIMFRAYCGTLERSYTKNESFEKKSWFKKNVSF